MRFASVSALLVVIIPLVIPLIAGFRINDTLHSGRGDLAPTRGDLRKYVNASLIIDFTIDTHINSQSMVDKNRLNSYRRVLRLSAQREANTLFDGPTVLEMQLFHANMDGSSRTL